MKYKITEKQLDRILILLENFGLNFLNMKLDEISNIFEISKEELVNDYLKPPYLKNFFIISNDLKLLTNFFKIRYGDNIDFMFDTPFERNNKYITHKTKYIEIHNPKIKHPGGTLVYLEGDGNWNEFEYLPNGKVLNKSEYGVEEEIW